MASLLGRLEVYLDEILMRPPHDVKSFYESPKHDINPLLVANKIGTTVPRVHGLLYMCFEAGVITPRWDIYCPETEEFIESRYTPEEAGKDVECHYHEFETVHSLDEFPVMLMFQFAPHKIPDDMRVAV